MRKSRPFSSDVRLYYLYWFWPTPLNVANVITFTRLTELIQVPKPPLDILAALDKNGLYIKGVWVAKRFAECSIFFFFNGNLKFS